MRRRILSTVAYILVGTIGANKATAAGPDVAQVLAVKPAQAGVDYDTPEQQTWAQCRLDVQKSPAGWVLYDPAGRTLRRFIDTNGDNIVDQWSYYKNGDEVYRDSDTTKSGKANDHRWYNSAGCRWGVDQNEDGVIDVWKRISAEEAAAEALAALTERNTARMQAVLLTSADMQALGLSNESADRVRKAQQAAASNFATVAGKLPAGAKWMQFDGHRPVAVPASEVDATDDVVLYMNATIIADAGGQTVWLRAAEIVRVGDVWKLTSVPTLIEPNKPLETVGILVPAHDAAPPTAAAAAALDPMVEDNEEVRKYVAMLQQHDESLPSDDDATKLVNYHIKRAEICAYIGAKSREMKNREHWYRQCADSINAAVQTGEYEQGINSLSQYSEQFARTSWGKDLAAYYQYRAINSAYAVELSKPSADHAKAQEQFLTQLTKFLADFPQSSDAGDALWQLGNGKEFSSKVEEAIEAYKKLVAQFPENPIADKARGALRRLEGEGKPFQLVGESLSGGGKLDSSRLRGKVVVVTYWATWCEPCKANMPNLKKLREKFGPQGLEIVGVCLDTNKQAAEAFLRSHGYDWPQIYEEGAMESGPAVQYGVISLPFTMLVDSEGRILDRNVQYQELESQVEKALAQKIATRGR